MFQVRSKMHFLSSENLVKHQFLKLFIEADINVSKYYTSCCQVHMLSGAHVVRCTCCQVHMLSGAHMLSGDVTEP